MNLPIEDLKVSKPCLDSLRKSGFSTVGELIEVLEQIWGGRAGTVGYAPFFEYLDETVNQLKALGCWGESLEP
jgi:hypothetical protein